MKRESKPSKSDDPGSALAEERAARVRLQARIEELEAQNARLNEAERRARDSAHRSEQVRDHCLSVLSHDLRGPIGTILTWAHLLRGGQLSADKTTQALAAIERSARGQVRLLEHVVDLARLRSGRLAINVQPTDLLGVARAAVEEARGAAEAKQIDLSVHSDNGSAEVDGDADRLRQVVSHLLDNAIRATPDRGRVEVVVQGDGDGTEVVVRDHGAGLEAGLAATLIAEARQPAPPARGRRGLGLALAVGLTELQGGSLELTSEGIDRGAVARVRFPSSRSS